MGVAGITDGGLAKRLIRRSSQEVLVRTERNDLRNQKRGRLVFYPDRFAVLLPDERRVNLIVGKSIVSLWHGRGDANYDGHWVDYNYVGRCAAA